MKKLWMVLLTCCLCAFLFASCELKEEESATQPNSTENSEELSVCQKNGHVEVIDESVDPTCTENGKTQGSHCSVCSLTIISQEEIPAFGHTAGDWVTDREPTCTINGERNKLCLTCGEVLDTEIIEASHTEVVDEAVEPTCTQNGLTAGKHCTVCNVSTVPQEEIPAQGHTDGEEWIVEENATCTEDGLRYKVCTVCNETSRTDVIKASHTESIKESVEPSCTESGWSAGKYCTVCNTVIVPQEEIPQKGHTDSGEWIVDQHATCTETGSRHKICAVCGENFKAEVIDATGHTLIEHEAQTPTCTEIGWDAYVTCSECTYSTRVDLPVVKHDYVSGYCSVCGDKYYSKGLKFTLMPDGLSYRVSSRGGCVDLYIVIPPTYNDLPVTKIGDNAFVDENTITGVEIPASVTEIGKSAFAGCTRLKSVILPERMTLIDTYAFSGCSTLEEVIIPNGVTSIRQAFISCTALKHIEIPVDVTDLYYAFSNCKALETVILPEGITEISGYAFSHCTSLTEITLPSTVRVIGEWAFANCSLLSTVTTLGDLEEIGSCAFLSCTSIVSIELPETISVIGKSAFSRCTSLLSIIVPSDVTELEGVFDGCTSLVDVQLPEKVWNLKGTFVGCTALSNVVLPQSVTNLNSTFQNCVSIRTISLPDGITCMDWAFRGCTNLTSVVIPKGTTEIGAYAFEDCVKLTSVTFHQNVSKIASYAFQNCDSLKTVVLHTGLTYIGVRAFFASGLRTVNYTGSIVDWSEIENKNSESFFGVGVVYGYVE